MRTLTERDVTMFHIMESMKRLSKCIDKQVVCLIVDASGAIVSSGVNTVIACDRNCDDKEHRTCVVLHAEIVALHHLDKAQYHKDGLTAYVSLFPCKACQEAITPYVNEIVTFGMIHKEWVSDKIVVFGHPVYDAIGDFVWPYTKELEYETVDEESNAEFDHEVKRAVKQRVYKDFYYVLNALDFKSFRKALEDAGKNGLIAYTKSTYIKR